MTRPTPLRPLLAALLAALFAASTALAGEPASGSEERVIVVLESGTDAAAAAREARGIGARVDRTFGAVEAYAARVTPAEASRIGDDPDVAAIVPDERIGAEEALAGQTVPTGIDRISGPASAAAQIDGLDVGVDADVAIYDTGIDPSNPELAVAGGYNCTSSDRSAWGDGYGHGTHVAGTVGARDNGSGVVGVAPGVRLWAVRILDAKGEGYLSWWICGLDWIASQVDPVDPSRPLIEVVNMSVTRWGRDDLSCGTTNDDVLHQAICRVVARGITVVAAAANDSGPVSKRVPASYNEVITVSALADTDGQPGGLGGNRCWSWGSYDRDDTFADFSNYGADVDLIAPGKCILSTKLGRAYGYMSGTSMAAPHVTGAAALYLATRPAAPPSEVKWALQYLGNRSWKTTTDPDGSPDILLDVSRLGPLGDFMPSATLPPEGLVAGEAGTTWTVPLAVGRSPGLIEPITFSVASAPAPLAAAIAGTATLRGSAAAGSLTITVPPSTPAGSYDVVVQATYRTLRIHEVHVPVVVENAPPVAAPPVPTLVRGTRTSQTGVALRLAWPAAVDQSPIGRYDVGEVVTGDPAAEPVTVASTGAAVREATRTIPFATPRIYGVRAMDAPGNLGPWALAEPVSVIAVQESSSTVQRSAGWSGYASAYALGGKSTSSTRAGAWMRYTFTGRAVALVGPKGPTRGRAEVWLDGALVGKVSASAATAGSRWVLHAMAVDPTIQHTIEVRVLETPGHPHFDVDAFLVLR